MGLGADLEQVLRVWGPVGGHFWCLVEGLLEPLHISSFVVHV